MRHILLAVVAVLGFTACGPDNSVDSVDHSSEKTTIIPDDAYEDEDATWVTPSEFRVKGHPSDPVWVFNVNHNDRHLLCWVIDPQGDDFRAGCDPVDDPGGDGDS